MITVFLKKKQPNFSELILINEHPLTRIIKNTPLYLLRTLIAM